MQAVGEEEEEGGFAFKFRRNDSSRLEHTLIYTCTPDWLAHEQWLPNTRCSLTFFP